MFVSRLVSLYVASNITIIRIFTCTEQDICDAFLAIVTNSGQNVPTSTAIPKSKKRKSGSLLSYFPLSKGRPGTDHASATARASAIVATGTDLASEDMEAEELEQMAPVPVINDNDNIDAEDGDSSAEEEPDPYTRNFRGANDDDIRSDLFNP